MVKNKQSNLIACLQTLNIGFIKKYAMTSGIVSYQSLFQNLFTLALLSPNYFLYKINYSVWVLHYRILWFTSFWQKRTKSLPLATSYPIYANTLFMFELSIFVPRSKKAVIFIKIGLTLNYFSKKNMQNFRRLGAPPPDPKTALSIGGQVNAKR